MQQRKHHKTKSRAPWPRNECWLGAGGSPESHTMGLESSDQTRGSEIVIISTGHLEEGYGKPTRSKQTPTISAGPPTKFWVAIIHG